ncbi:glutamine amidotransferase [Cytobacillus horneckiae]|uniref:Glutamine amidotransferase n=1 Tax=Cytobacillus horneckiae TaxID=549687 RepID=A0A2N0ZC43_9BACI|nr:glutamine amidotransferase [Cytobacillus horneckiae]
MYFLDKKRALLLVFEGYCEFEIAPAISMISNRYELFTISNNREAVRSEAGLLTVPTITFSEANVEDYELLIIPGGDMLPIVNDEKYYQWVHDFCGKKRVIAAICSGPYVLARSNLLESIPYTVTLSKEQRKFLGVFKEAYFTYEPIVRSSPYILTAQGHAYVEFAIELNKMINNVSEAAVDFYRGNKNHFME